MDADERALLNAVIAQPEEDTPRLVYADWLQEHDRPERAELIRVQIGLARSKGDESAAPQRTAWQTRVRILLRLHSERWRDELPVVPRVRWGAFERGMVESVTLKIRYWPSLVLADLANLFGHAPLRTLRVHFAQWSSDPPKDYRELLRWEGLRRFDELHLAARFHERPGEDMIGPLLAPLWGHAWADRPRVIDLRECVTERAVQPLIDDPLRPLPTLVLPTGAFSERGRAVLTARLGRAVRFV